MTVTLKCRIKSYIQPFERKLALAELASLAGAEPHPAEQSNNPLQFEVQSETPTEVLTNRLAYWECVTADQPHITVQSLRESTVNAVRNGIPPEQIAELVPFDNNQVPLPNRRCLRYGTHGIHEYRGKFFPQLVRSLLNIAKVPENGLVADPMSGSGTTIVETVLTGCRGIGLDINPLSVLMARTKCALLVTKAESLIAAYQGIRKTLLRATPPRTVSDLPYLASLPAADQKYLSAWFSEQVLADLDQIATTIGALEDDTLRDLMRLSLSNIIRSVSWQKSTDLRVRKEVRLDADIDPIKDFLEELGRSVRTVLALLYQNEDLPPGTFDIMEGSACDAGTHWRQWRGQVDTIITSPPYATALPYLDTDRLSLCYLGLLTRPEHRRRDHQMIGNREITEKERKAHWRLFQEKKENLPTAAVELIERVEELNSSTEVGFRRRNLSALLAKYFFDMRDVFDGMAQLLRPGASAYVVVGNNHTIAGGERVDIETANLLIDIAVAVGLEPGEHVPMEMLVSRDIFRNNAIASEVILSFRRPA